MVVDCLSGVDRLGKLLLIRMGIVCIRSDGHGRGLSYTLLELRADWQVELTMLGLLHLRACQTMGDRTTAHALPSMWVGSEQALYCVSTGLGCGRIWEGREATGLCQASILTDRERLDRRQHESSQMVLDGRGVPVSVHVSSTRDTSRPPLSYH